MLFCGGTKGKETFHPREGFILGSDEGKEP